MFINLGTVKSWGGVNDLLPDPIHHFNTAKYMCIANFSRLKENSPKRKEKSFSQVIVTKGELSALTVKEAIPLW